MHFPVRNPQSAIRMQVVAEPKDTADTERPTPGLQENDLFGLDISVLKWQNFQRHGPASTSENVAEIAAVASRIVTKDPAYAAAHGLRVSYFTANAVLGTLAFELHERLRNSGASGDTASVTSIAGFGNVGGLGIDGTVASRLILEALMCFEQDLEAITAGEYKHPWDAATLSHRQYTPQFAMRQTSRFISEAVGTLGRRSRGDPADIGVWMSAADGLYPDYYLNNYHYQTDGWLSQRSANVYETSTETLFVGRQDAMQRSTLRPLLASGVASANGGKPRILEVACGTGRFATFVRDNLPSCEMTAVDLSPFYLDAARENDAYWGKTRAGTGFGVTSKPAPIKLTQANAETLPFEDGSFDAVVCVYLFHELPSEARANAAREMARVVAPGGTVVLTDSMQKGDRPALDEQLSRFSNLNEPHYNGYIETHLGELFCEDAGLVRGSKIVASSSKTLSFRKPELTPSAEGSDMTAKDEEEDTYPEEAL